MADEWPPEAEIRQWWKEQRKFSQTELGHLWLVLGDRLQHIQHERDVYRRVVLDWAATQPDAKDIRDKIEAAREALNTQPSSAGRKP